MKKRQMKSGTEGGGLTVYTTKGRRVPMMGLPSAFA